MYIDYGVSFFIYWVGANINVVKKADWTPLMLVYKLEIITRKINM